MKVIFHSNSPKETKRLARVLTHHITSPATILLNGDLGAGKTFLVKAFTEATGSQAETSSPSFSLINCYDIPGGKINHLDLYRISDYDELFEIGLDEILNEEALNFIEWPDIAEISEPDYNITIKSEIGDKRTFLIESDRHDLKSLEEELNGA